MEFYFLFFLSLGHHFYIKRTFKRNLSALMILQNSTSKKKTFQMTTLHLGWAIRICTTNNILETRLQEFPKAITKSREEKVFPATFCMWIWWICTTTVLNLFSVWQFSVFWALYNFKERQLTFEPRGGTNSYYLFTSTTTLNHHILLDHFICIGIFWR